MYPPDWEEMTPMTAKSVWCRWVSNVRPWLTSEVPATSEPRPVYPQQETFDGRCPVSGRFELIWALAAMARALPPLRLEAHGRCGPEISENFQGSG